MLEKNRFYNHAGKNLLYLGELNLEGIEKNAQFLFLGEDQGKEYASLARVPLDKLIEKEDGTLELKGPTKLAQSWIWKTNEIETRSYFNNLKNTYNNALEKEKVK